MLALLNDKAGAQVELIAGPAVPVHGPDKPIA